MKHISVNEEHNTSKLKRETKTVKITHRFHPLYGQTARIIRSRRGTYARLTVEVADGTRMTVEPDQTDLAEAPAQDIDTTDVPLLDIGGLLNIAKLIKRIDSED